MKGGGDHVTVEFDVPNYMYDVHLRKDGPTLESIMSGTTKSDNDPLYDLLSTCIRV
jgi:hypothetical protein